MIFPAAGGKQEGAGKKVRLPFPALPCALLAALLLAAPLPGAAANPPGKESTAAEEGAAPTPETGSPPATPATPPAARVNGVEISMPMLQKTFERNLEERGIDVKKIKSRERLGTLRMEVLNVLIDQELLWQQAKEKGIVAKDEEVELVIAAVTKGLPFEEAFAAILNEGGFTEEGYREFIRAQISVSRLIETDIAAGIATSDGEVSDYYAENPGLFTPPEEVRTRRIMVGVEQGAGEKERREARARIEGVLVEAKGGADFAELARKHSEGPEAPRGGDLGFLGRGKMPRPLEDAAFSLKPGGISEVLETPLGYHILRVEERRGGKPVPEAEVGEKIRTNLTRQKIREAVQKRVRELREKGTVEILVTK